MTTTFIPLIEVKPRTGFSSLRIKAKFSSGEYYFTVDRECFKQLSEANSKMAAFNKWLQKRKETKSLKDFLSEIEELCLNSKSGKDLIAHLVK